MTNMDDIINNVESRVMGCFMPEDEATEATPLIVSEHTCCSQKIVPVELDDGTKLYFSNYESLNNPTLTLNDKLISLGEIGRGGMGSVSLMLLPGTGQHFAYKIVHLNFPGSFSPEFIQEKERPYFESELVSHLEAVGDVQDPTTSAPKIYEAGQRSDGKFYMIMQYLEGRTLYDILQDPEDDLNIEEKLLISMGIAKDLDAYHKKGFVHRDVKTANIMLTDKDVHLCDYGLAKKVGEHRPYESKSRLIGTPSCMAPEILDGVPENAQTDLFSFGMVLYELFTGTNPIREEYSRLHSQQRTRKADAPVSFVQKEVYSKIKLPQAVADNIPDQVAEIIEKCTEMDPRKRYRTGAEVLDDLKSAYEALPQATLASYTRPLKK